MKNTFVILLTMFYLVLASGFTKYTHFCKGVKMETRLTNNHEQGKPCPLCQTKNKARKEARQDCCKHEQQVIKMTDKVQKITSQQSGFKFWGNVIPNRTLGAVFDPSFKGSAYPVERIFPKIPVPGNPLYILHCVYRI